jgi:parvulin-like peptidyl-prolyl isomerase
MPKQRQISQKKNTVTQHQRSGDAWYKRPRNIVIIAVLLIIIGVGGWSVYNFQIRPYHQTVLMFNDSTFDMRYFINALKAYYGKAPSDSNISTFADYVEQQIERNEKIIQGSAALGVQIPRSDIVSILSKSHMSLNQENVDILMAQELIDRQVPASQPQYKVQAMLLESEETAQIAINRLQSGEDFLKVNGELSRFPTATNTNPAQLGWITPRQADISLSSARFGDIISNANAGVLSGPVYDDTVFKQFGYWVAKIVEKSYASDNITIVAAHYQGILVGSEKEADNILDELNTGTDFNELAKEFSLMPGAKDNGAEIGWLSENLDPSLFDALAGRPLNTIVGPIGDNRVETAGGYWVYNVLEKNNSMALTSDQRSELVNDLLNRCTAALLKNPKYQLKNLLTPEMKDFALNQVVSAQGEGSVLIGTNSLPVGEQGVNYYCKIKAYGYQKGNIWSVTDGVLPDGLSLDESTGVISGVPTFGGGGGFTLRVENRFHFNEQQFTYQIRLAVSVNTKSLPDGQLGTAYFQILEVISDVEINWSIIKGNLPDGLNLEKNTGIISGTPAAAGTFSFTVQVDDGIGKGQQDLTINVR